MRSAPWTRATPTVTASTARACRVRALKPGEDSGGVAVAIQRRHRRPSPRRPASRPAGVLRIVFSRAKYPNIRRHFIAAVGKGWPRVMVINRKGADERRDRLLEDVPDPRRASTATSTPPPSEEASPTATSAASCAGSTPVGWMADVAYVPSSENRSHGSSLGAKLRRSATAPSSSTRSTEAAPAPAGPRSAMPLSSRAEPHPVASLAELRQARGHRVPIEPERLCHVARGGARVCSHVIHDTGPNVAPRRTGPQRRCGLPRLPTSATTTGCGRPQHPVQRVERTLQIARFSRERPQLLEAEH